MAELKRKARDFDCNIFENLCAIQCTMTEIAAVFSTSREALKAWIQREYGIMWDEIYKRYAAQGRMSLRRNQMKLSETNAQMAIWLGKQYLGQRDLPKEVEEFNGKLSQLLDFLCNLKKDDPQQQIKDELSSIDGD